MPDVGEWKTNPSDSRLIRWAQNSSGITRNILLNLYVFWNYRLPRLSSRTRSQNMDSASHGGTSVIGHSSKRYTLKEIRDMSPLDFERFVAMLYDAKGYGCELTTGSGDHGADVIAENQEERIVIQAKRHEEGNSVTPSAVRDAHASCDYYNAKRAVVVATSDFSQNAHDFAAKADVELVSGNELIAQINRYLP